MTSPLVSILIPSYKASHFEQCLRSALGQTYLNIEILVSDNCPTEDIRDICRKFPQVIYQRNPEKGNHNIMSSLFSGKGTYLKPLFDDDLLHPFCIERMVTAMSLHPEIELVFSASQIIDSDNLRVQTRRPFPSSGIMAGAQLYRMLAMGPINVVGEQSSIMFKRRRLWDIGASNLFTMAGHDFGYGLADVAFYCNLSRDSQAYYIDEELTYFRRDPRHPSNSNPAANPNYGLCLSDGIDLALSAHQEQVMSTEDLLACRPAISKLMADAGHQFTQLPPAHQRFQDRLAQLGLL
nr:glycosyltransferase family A protein [uncultured Duganella sp.]